ncbi:Leukemia inhibitory factor receptor [Bagarius yarrelli]|uniref:Leukemia inhibitory factor receptor n=1 Tax=Bagarius yarrelli TaxID=175774 RepID=A0A556VCT4_BAGYA|nr:Leukemia inhibitory factor receptor [Bagarius yarrelli]
MLLLWSVNLLFFVSLESTDRLELMLGQNTTSPPGSGESADLSVEVCVRSSWSLEVRWTENQHTAEQTYQIQIGQGQQNVGSNRLRLFPMQEVLQEGSSIFFCCIPSDGAHITALHFFNTPYPLIHISPRVRAIRVLGLNTTNMGVNFICQDNLGTRRAVLNYVTFPPEKPKNLSCETSNLKNVVCSWTPGRTPNLSGVRRRRYTLHILNSDGRMFSCDARSSSCQFPVFPHLIFYNISVVVSEKIGALAVEECESCEVEIMEQELHTHTVLTADSDHEELMTATNLTYLLLSNTPEHAQHSDGEVKE